MSRRILIIQGHPDPAAGHFGQALVDAYRAGAEAAGHSVEEVHLADLDYPMLRSEKEWTQGEVPESLKPVQAQILKADHLVFVFPLWLGTLPARMKAFLEQVLRPGFAFSADAREGIGEQRFPDIDGYLLSMIIAATVVFELLGPPCTRLALRRAGESGRAVSDGEDETPYSP